MNGGVTPCIVALNTVYVLIAAYFIFGERLNYIKVFAISMLISCVILIALFNP